MERISSLLNAYSMVSIFENPRSLTSVLHETRAFHETPVDAPKCSRLITELIYLLGQGSTIGETEQNDLFFAFMKLFQSQNSRLRRMVFLLLKDMSEGASSVFMVTNSLSKDMQSKNDCYRANAIRVSSILDTGTVAQIERYLKAAVVDKSPFVATAALACGSALINTNPEMIRRWVNEVGEALGSKHAMVQFHGLGLMHELKKQDRLALQKLICGLASGQQGGPVGTRSPQVECLLVEYATRMILTENDSHVIRVLLTFLDSSLRNRSEAVNFEAARALCLLAQKETNQSGSRILNAGTTMVMGVDFMHAITVLQIALGSSKPVNRLASLRTLNTLSKSRPTVVAKCNVDIEPLLCDDNRNIATLALTVLLKTAQESSVEKLVKQIGNFMTDLTDIYKLDVVNAVRSLCASYPDKFPSMLGFLSSALREEGSQEVKQAVAAAMISISDTIPEALEQALLSLCEFIEDCEFPNLCCTILAFLTDKIVGTGCPARYIRFVYNRLILENATVRAAAIESLTRIAVKRPELKENIIVLLENASCDTDDEVRDRLSLYIDLLDEDSRSTRAGSEVYIESVLSDNLTFSVDALYEALEQHVTDPSTSSQPFDILSVPDDSAYRIVLREREASAAALSVAITASVPANPTPASSTSFGSIAPRPDLHATLRAIIDPDVLGPVQHISRPQYLTEAEAEYTVQIIKHVFKIFTVFEFVVSNTVEGVVLANVQVNLGNVDSSLWKEEGSLPITTVAYGEESSAFTVLARKSLFPTGTFSASLHFLQREDGDPVGFPDDFPIDHVKILMSDFISPRPLPVGQFTHAWEALGSKGVERVQKYALNYRTLDATVSGLISSLNMAPCEGTERLEPGVQKPTLFLAGNFVGGIPILAAIILYIHPQRGCMVQVTSRGGTEEACNAVLRSME